MKKALLTNHGRTQDFISGGAQTYPEPHTAGGSGGAAPPKLRNFFQFQPENSAF
ncbi:MAG: hypothetical protein GY820_08475 [Gammaproteobacteria bacterium]|nr:hypothetical protein [Gammaproteobacteria bacterium]